MTASAELSVASYNIHKGVGTDRRRDLVRIEAVIGEIGADILALQEVDTRFGTRKGLLDLDALRQDLGLIPVPVEGVGTAHGWHGNLLLVRNAVVQQVQQVILPGFEPRGAMITDLTVAGLPLRIVNAHFGLLPASRSAQARAVLDKLAGMAGRATLLMGDLNEWRSGALALRTLGTKFALPVPRPSFPSRFPVLALDRIMASGSCTLSDVAVHASPLSRRASDHLPLCARFLLSAA